jgi:hypothetical protein
VLELLNSKKTAAAVALQLSALQDEVNAHSGLNASGAVVVSHMKMVDRSVYSQIQASSMLCFTVQVLSANCRTGRFMWLFVQPRSSKQT